MSNGIYWILFLAVVFTVSSCQNRQEDASQLIVISNPSAVALKAMPVRVKRNMLHVPEGDLFPLVTNEKGDSIAVQMDDSDGDHRWDDLFLLADLPPGADDTLQVRWVPQALAFPRRTHVRFGVRQTLDSRIEPAVSDTFYPDQLPGVIGYQHYQTDGPTWENDEVGFRLYLDGRYSVDVFGKTKAAITPDSVGIGKDGLTENNYSEMKDWGMDILAVGNSVGIGGISLLIKDSLERLGVTEQDSLGNVDTTIFTIRENGPILSRMTFSYRGWKTLGRSYNVQENISMWPGISAFKNQVVFDHLKGDESLVVGLVNLNTSKALTEIPVNEDWVVLLIHDRQTVDKKQMLGLALILPRKAYQGAMKAPGNGKLSNTYLGKLKIVNSRPLSYYAVACWEGRDPRFKDEAFFTQYVVGLARQLDVKIKINVL